VYLCTAVLVHNSMCCPAVSYTHLCTSVLLWMSKKKLLVV
jgi:hypothetical protein